MARWRDKGEDDNERFEKVGKIRKRSLKKTHAGNLQDNFELKEKKWVVGGKDGAFAARVVEVHKRYAFVSSEPELGAVDTHDVWLAEVARKFLVAAKAERNFVAVGDRVLCTPDRDQVIEKKSDLPKCVIQNLSPRLAKIARLDPHNAGLEHVLATNMDQLMIVASYLSPSIKWGLVDRYLVLAESEGIDSIIVLNKSDLLEEPGNEEAKADAEEKIAIYGKLGYSVYSVQANRKGAAKDPVFKEIGERLSGKVTLLSGHSGVGKSSIVNLYKPEIIQAVEPDEDIFYKGRHTTSFASFIKLGRGGGFCIDTPGIRSFTFEDKGPIELSHCFVEFRPLLGKCKFRECSHFEEPECVVRDAVEAGEISRWRYKSYLGILFGATGREGRIRDLPLDPE